MIAAAFITSFKKKKEKTNPCSIFHRDKNKTKFRISCLSKFIRYDIVILFADIMTNQKGAINFLNYFIRKNPCFWNHFPRIN